MAKPLPTGTVTFLFSDVEGSTRKLEEVGVDRYADALGEHRRLLRDAFDRHGGVEVDTQGDAFFIAFPTAQAAVLAAADAQRALGETDVRVRIGVHSGEAAAGDEGYVGMDVHRGARVASAAHGGQVVLSQTTRELVGDALPDELALRDLGEHRLKDLTRPQRLHQLVIAGLPHEFPPLRTLEQRPTNLPVQQVPLIGRDLELREARELLSRTRVLTLTGAGGVGKTRLALQLAADVLDEYDDGVFVVDLADVADPRLAVPTIAQVLGLKERGGVELVDALAEYVAGKRMLLVLDNMEHLVDAAPQLSRLSAAAPHSKVVATSRTPLRITGEQEFPVPPLPLDAAVELFVERARAVRPGFALDGDRAAVAEICARLDALPLAIELAAARVKLLPPPKLLERLEQRLPVLTGGARDAPARHRTLRAAIDWSFGLLEPEEQELLARLSVFVGGFTVEAAEDVCDATIDGLASLVDKSLVVERDAGGAEPRFALLETVREYARERLEERAEADDVSERHAHHFLEVFARPLSEIRTAGFPELGAETLSADFANLRAAATWFDRTGDAENLTKLATGAYMVLWPMGRNREMHGWLERALACGASLDLELRADLLGRLALAAAHLDDSSASRRYAEESLALARQLGDDVRTEWALRACAWTEEDPAEARRLLEQCESLLVELGDHMGLAWVMHSRAEVEQRAEQYEQARAFYEEAAQLFERLGSPFGALNSRGGAGQTLLLLGRTREAEEVLRGVLAEAREVVPSGLATPEVLAWLGIARLERDVRAATRLLGKARSLARELGIEVVGLPLVAGAERTARERLGDEFDREWSAWAELTLEEAVALALDEI